MQKPPDTDYDAEKVKAAILKTAGSWSDIDTDAMIAALYRARKTGSWPGTAARVGEGRVMA